jgi:hypothetical protein
MQRIKNYKDFTLGIKLMRQIAFLFVVACMISIGSYFLYVQLFNSPIIYFKIVSGSGMLIAMGVYMVWEEIIVPYLARNNDKSENE